MRRGEKPPRLSVPTKPVTEHLADLHDHGITYAYIQRRTGLSVTTIQDIRRGTYQRCYLYTAKAIMDIKAPR